MTSTYKSSHNILIIVQNLPVPFDRRVWQEARTLRAQGFGVTVICPKSDLCKKSHERLDGIEIYRYPLMIEADSSRAAYFLEFAYCWVVTLCLSLLAYIERPFHVIHACNPPDTYFLIALMFRWLGVKFVFDHHDLSPELYTAKGHAKRGLTYRVLCFFERMTFTTADLVIAANESYREIAEERGHVPTEKIAVVRSAPSHDWPEFRESNPSLKHGRKYLALFVGQLGKQDGIDYLLRAIRIYRDSYPHDTTFAIVGGGPQEQQMRKLAVELEIEDCVYFTGRVSDNELISYLSEADVCVDPDPLNDFNNASSMNKIVEYMSFGKPIVAFDLLEHRRTAIAGACYVEPNNVTRFAASIRDLLQDASRRERMGSFSKARFHQSLAWEISEKQLVRAYSNLVNQPMESGVSAPTVGCVES